MDAAEDVKDKVIAPGCPGLLDNKSLNELKDSTITSKNTSSESPIASIQTQGAFIEHYLQLHISQSRIDGRRSSLACTLIALLMSHRFLCKGLQIVSDENGGQLLPDTCDAIISCLRQGNHIYESCGMKGLLSIDQGLSALSKLHTSMELQKRSS